MTEASVLRERMAEASGGLPASVPSQPTAVAPNDFAQHLGLPLPASRIVQELQRACAQAGMTLVAVQAQSRAPSLDQLGRLEIAVTLRGTYIGTKQALKQVIERYPAQLTMSRLRMQRSASSGEVESLVVLSVWSAPLNAATVEEVVK